jgi:hypothetical protein
VIGSIYHVILRSEINDFRISSPLLFQDVTKRRKVVVVVGQTVIIVVILAKFNV